MDSVNIAGISITLRTWSKDELKGLPVIYSFSYRFYDFSFRGSQMRGSEDLLCFTLTTSYITNASDW